MSAPPPPPLAAAASAAGNLTALDAFQKGTLGVSWGGAGFLILYYVGVVKVLRQLGVLHDATPVAGISSGALTAGAVCSGMHDDKFYHIVTSLLNGCRKSGGCAGRMDANIQALLKANLPADAARKCSGKFYVGVTVMGEGAPKSVLTAGFKDRADLISTLAASAYVPIWSGRSLFTVWRGMQTADGSLSAQQPCPPQADYCLRVASRWPDLPRPSMGETMGAIVRALAGLPSAAAGLLKPKLPDAPPPARAPAAEAALASARAAGVDIAPGVSGAVKNTWDGPTWTELGLIPCDPETCDFLYRMGQLDAMAWAEGTGIAQAAAAKMRAARATVEGAAKPWAAAPAGGDGGAAEGEEGARVVQG